MRYSIANIGVGVIALTAATIGTVATAAPASATQDTACLRAGIGTLQEAGLLATVARDGLPIAKAVSLGVEPRPGTDVASLPDPLPLRVVLADHRAGDDSLFIYPWC